MQETTTTCDRCGKTDQDQDIPASTWAQLWIPAGNMDVDLCDQCGKALLGWVQTGIEVKAGVRVEHPPDDPKPLPPGPRDRTPGFA